MNTSEWDKILKLFVVTLKQIQQHQSGITAVTTITIHVSYFMLEISPPYQRFLHKCDTHFDL